MARYKVDYNLLRVYEHHDGPYELHSARLTLNMYCQNLLRTTRGHSDPGMRAVYEETCKAMEREGISIQLEC